MRARRPDDLARALIPGLVFAMLIVAAAAGCSPRAASVAAPASQPEVVLRPAGAPPVRVRAEVVRTPEEVQRGLMFRERLEPGRGMLFVFSRPQQLSFWMRNTYIPLDMIFIGADRRVVGVVENATPLTDDARRVEGLSQFVLEVPGGWTAPRRIGPGTTVEFVGVM